MLEVQQTRIRLLTLSRTRPARYGCAAQSPALNGRIFPYLGAKSVDVLMAHREVVLASLCLLGSRDAREEVA